MVEFMLRHEQCPVDLRTRLIKVFEQPPHVAYRVLIVNGVPIVSPRASLESGEATRQALKTVENIGPDGAKAHLQNAASDLNAADYAGSIGNSILAMEAVARTIEPKARTLSQALQKLDKKGFLGHSAIKQAFEKLYGYASDEKGIRHSMTGEGAPNVGLDEAMFMFSASAAGAAYLVKKHAEKRNSP